MSKSIRSKVLKNVRSISYLLILFICVLAIAGVREVGAQGTFTTIRDIPYVADSLPGHRLDLYIPNGATSATPLIVWVHGGGWILGDKSLDASAPQFRYARGGYAVASINYRLSGTAIFPAQIHDCKAAIRFLRANAAQYNLDTNRFAAWGSSAGGHLVALLGTSSEVADMEGTVGGNLEYSSRIQAVADWFGPTDFLQMDTQTAAQGCPAVGHSAANSPESILVGCPIQTCPQAVQRANPMTYLSPDDPPFFIQHGTADCTVPIGQSVILQNLMQMAGNDSVYLPIAGANHGGVQFSTEANLVQLDPFFESKLRQRAVTNVAISGRVLTPDGRGLRSSNVKLTDPQGIVRSATTSSFGNYQILNIPPGPVYTLTVASKRYRFSPKLFQLISDLSLIDLTGAE